MAQCLHFFSIFAPFENVLFQFYKTESPENIYSEEFEPRLKDSYVAELLKVPYMRTRDNITLNKGDKALCVKKVHDNLEYILVEVLWMKNSIS